MGFCFILGRSKNLKQFQKRDKSSGDARPCNRVNESSGFFVIIDRLAACSIACLLAGGGGSCGKASSEYAVERSCASFGEDFFFLKS